ncbi:outer membrane beta-barrel protein [Pontibacter sp. SGAir0037]|uniref:outer membrane beta-barrel protein n=1 Tax=Pontibacter sp. SGAir0037 TaxID=2571030 RepID=UPI0010CD0179|nr:outer membrane beta-barrel protein [Pontibacter sp. SGAir0037]QCR23231.1 hypothetical protein C1N53_13360 [Pontibacter sp. SGAir0037]
MKKLILFSIVALISFKTSAQFGNTNQDVYDAQYNRVNDPATTVRYGIRAGLNAANITDDPTVVDANAGIGTEFGIFARIGQRFYVQPGVDFVNNSINIIRASQPRQGERDEVVVRFIRLPVLVGLQTQSQQFGRNRSFSRYRLSVGPSFAFGVGVSDNNLDVRRRNVTNAQFALNGGIGVDIWRFGVDVMYHHGLSNVFNDNTATGKYRNFSLALSLVL